MSPKWLVAAAAITRHADDEQHAADDEPPAADLVGAGGEPASLGHIRIESVLCLPEIAGEVGAELGKQR